MRRLGPIAVFACCALAGLPFASAQPKAAPKAAAPAAKAAPQKTAEEWMAELDGPMHLEAIDSLARMGATAKVAVPKLTRLLDSSDDQARWRSARALGAMGSAAESAVPVLLKHLGAPESEAPVRAQSAAALGKIGVKSDEVLNTLVLSVGDPEVHVRHAAIEALRRLGPEPSMLIPVFTQVLNDSHPDVAVRAMAALADIGEAAVPALIEATKEPKARHWATVVLAEMGPKAAPAVSALEKLAMDPEPEVRMQALIALGQIGDAAKPAIPTILKGLTAEEQGVRYGAIFALGKLRSEEAFVDLEKMVDTKDPILHLIDAWALARIHPNDPVCIRRAIDSIVQGLESDDPQLSRTAVRALAEANFSPEEMTPAVRAALDEIDPTVLEHVLMALSDLGEKAVPMLTKAINDPKTRDAAIRALARIGPEAKGAVPILITMLADKNPLVVADAATALARIGPDAASGAAALTALLSNADMEVRSAATNALGTIGAPAKAAVPALLKQVSGPEPMLVVASVWSIRRIEPENRALAPVATPILVKMLASDKPQIRYQAAAALADLGPPARAALPSLTKLLEDSDEHVRAMAGTALSRIQPPPKPK